jgi:hypothetical protein
MRKIILCLSVAVIGCGSPEHQRLATEVSLAVLRCADGMMSGIKRSDTSQKGVGCHVVPAQTP